MALVGCSPASGKGPAHVPTISSAPVSTPASPPVPRVLPASVDVPRIGAHSTLPPIGLKPDGSFQTPDERHPQQATFYCVTVPAPQLCSSGVLPGQPGPAVILGHIDGNKQKGIFHDLPAMQVGDLVTVSLEDRTVLTFTVYRVLSKAKTEFPGSIVYGNTTGPEIRLITCSGPFIGGSAGYADNTVVFAVLVPNPPGD